MFNEVTKEIGRRKVLIAFSYAVFTIWKKMELQTKELKVKSELPWRQIEPILLFSEEKV